MSSINLFAYNDFRRYLADWLAAKKAEDPRFTGAEVHRRLGLPNTRSFFPDVVSGKRVTETFVDRFIVLLDLDREESRFFRALVRYNQAESPEERELAFDQLVTFNRTPRTVLDQRQMSFYKDWKHGAIRALLDTGEYGDDPDRIAKELVPRLTPGQVRESLELLAGLERLAELGVPVLAGLSRKRSIGELTGRQAPAERVAGSVAAHLLAAQRGARIVRVHDVAATVDALKVWEAVAAVPAPRRDAAPAIRWPDDD